MKLENLSALFENGAYTLVLQKDGETIYKDFGRGVGPALRVYKAAYNESNEIGQLNTGDTVQVKDTSNDQYWYVYVPQLDKTGYVDRNYLTGGSGTTTPSMTVKVESGYLALRSTKAYDKDNEIAQLNNGDTVEVIEKKDSTYWYVYVPKLGKEGYVDKNYLK